MDESSKSPEGYQSGFPKSPSDFDADPRISYSRLDEKFILETEEGAEFEWDAALRRWIPVVGIGLSPASVWRRQCLHIHLLSK